VFNSLPAQNADSEEMHFKGATKRGGGKWRGTPLWQVHWVHHWFSWRHVAMLHASPDA